MNTVDLERTASWLLGIGEPKYSTKKIQQHGTYILEYDNQLWGPYTYTELREAMDGMDVGNPGKIYEAIPVCKAEKEQRIRMEKL